MTGNWAEIEKTLARLSAYQLASQRWRLRAQGAVVALVAVLIALVLQQWGLGHG